MAPVDGNVQVARPGDSNPLRHRRRLCVWLAALPLPSLPSAALCATPDATVAAASDLRHVLDQIVLRFQAAGGQKIRVVYGSSGNLCSQIEQGAPFGLFMSADEALVHRLVQSGHTLDAGQLYGVGRIVLMVPKNSRLKADGSLADLAMALRDGRLRKLAIANPQHAPYGARAREALQATGLWDAVQAHLVYGENVSQAAQFALSGSAQGGIVALSLALVPQIAALGKHALIDERLHQPLRQRMVLLKGASEPLRSFYRFLSTAPSREIMAQFGFVAPKE